MRSPLPLRRLPLWYVAGNGMLLCICLGVRQPLQLNELGGLGGRKELVLAQEGGKLQRCRQLDLLITEVDSISLWKLTGSDSG